MQKIDKSSLSIVISHLIIEHDTAQTFSYIQNIFNKIVKQNSKTDSMQKNKIVMTNKIIIIVIYLEVKYGIT